MRGGNIFVNTLIIYPKGNLCDRILVMISGILLAHELDIRIKMIWDHEVTYNNLFLNNIELISIDDLNNKKYIYNPNIDQSIIYNNLHKNTTSDMHVIIQTNKEFKHKNMSLHQYLLKRRSYYLHILKESMSGVLLGQINLIDFPSKPFIHICGTTYETSLNKLEINEKVFDVKNNDLLDYIKGLIASKADLIIHTKKDLNDDKYIIHASKVSMNPLICLNTPNYYDTFKNYSKDYLGFPMVINPDINKIALLL